MAMTEEINTGGGGAWPMGGAGYGYGGGDGFGGIVGLLAIFALFSGGGMWGGGNRGLSNEFQYEALNTNMQAGFNQVTTQANFDTVDLALTSLQGLTQQGFYNNARAIDAAGFQNVMAVKDAQFQAALIGKDAELRAQSCCCETNRNIDSVKTQMAQDTCAIITNQDKLASAAELREVYAKLAEKDLALSEARIVNAITANLQPPRPIPAYAAMNPYSTYVPNANCINNQCGVAAF